MRVNLIPFAFAVTTTFGCGDGIGHPIVEQNPVASGAGAPGGRGGGAGGMGGAPGDAPGSGARGGLPNFGGRPWGWDGARRGDRPPDVVCEGIADWPAESAEAERRLFDFLGFAREFGLSCTSGAVSTSVPPLAMKPELQCAARLHTRDMVDQGYVDHVNQQGLGPAERIRLAGYDSFAAVGESIAEDSGALEDIPYELISAGGSECQNLVDSRFDSVGIGRFGDLWTLDFTGP